MKRIKLVVLLLAICSTFSAVAQAKLEKKAQQFTDEITSVLSLTKEESAAVYEVQLNRFKENKSIQEEYADDAETKKEKLKKLGNDVFNNMKKIIGEERMKKWKEYKDKK